MTLLKWLEKHSTQGIAVTGSIYKAYCAVINNRLTKWHEDYNVFADEQNCFRRKRSTIDQLSTLTDIIECRKKNKQSTFVPSVDYSKAYDRIPRRILWSTLEKHGIQGKLLSAIQYLFENVKCAVNVDSYRTD